MANASVTAERLFIVRPEDPRLFCANSSSEKGGYQWHDLNDDCGTWFVVLGRETTDEKCHQMARRFGLEAEGLIAMRDDDRWVSVEAESWALGGNNG